MADTALKADTADTVEAVPQQSTPDPPRWYHFIMTFPFDTVDTAE